MDEKLKLKIDETQGSDPNDVKNIIAKMGPYGKTYRKQIEQDFKKIEEGTKFIYGMRDKGTYEHTIKMGDLDIDVVYKKTEDEKY